MEVITFFAFLLFLSCIKMTNQIAKLKEQNFELRRAINGQLDYDDFMDVKKRLG